MPKPYTLPAQQRQDFSILFLLDYIENQGALPVILEGDFALLDGLVTSAFNQGLIEILDLEYILTARGKQALRVFMARYSDFLASYDIFCAVDLTEGTFAFAEYWNMTEARFQEYLAEKRWEDLRIAVIEYKNSLSNAGRIDPVEIIFMDFLNKGRFDSSRPGWQFEIALGTAWDDIVRIASSQLQPQDLGYEGVPWEQVIRDVIEQGTALTKKLCEEENRLRASGKLEPQPKPEPGSITVTYVTETTYWDDPWYIYPVWFDVYW